MSSLQIEQKSYEIPQRDGFTATTFITVADIDRSADFYEKVFGGRILSSLILNVGGGPTPDKLSVTLSVPAPDKINGFMDIRVADIQACHSLCKSALARLPDKSV